MYFSLYLTGFTFLTVQLIHGYNYGQPRSLCLLSRPRQPQTYQTDLSRSCPTTTRVWTYSYDEQHLNKMGNEGKDSQIEKKIVITTLPGPSKNESGAMTGAILKGVKSNWLVLGEIAVIALAKWNPQLGATGGVLRPEIFISQLGVFIIFFINGVALSLSATPSELSNASKINAMIQFYNFGFIPIFVKLFSRYYPDPAFR